MFRQYRGIVDKPWRHTDAAKPFAAERALAPIRRRGSVTAMRRLWPAALGLLLAPLASCSEAPADRNADSELAYQVIRSGGILGRPMEVELARRDDALVVASTGVRIADAASFAALVAAHAEHPPEAAPGADYFIYRVVDPDGVAVEVVDNFETDNATTRELLLALERAFTAPVDSAADTKP